MRRAKLLARRLITVAVRVLFGPAIVSSLPRSAGAEVCLTFDDGPHPQNTRRILAILRARSVPATFFVTGEACEQHPELVRAIAAEGHQLANHGYSHYAPEEVSTAEYLEDVRRGQRTIERALGRGVPRVFRPPYGRVSLRTFLGLWRMGYELVLWNVDSRDSYVTEPADVAHNVMTSPVRPRSIVLLHEDYDWTVDALPALVNAIRAQGLSFTTLSGPTPTRLPADPVPSRERCA